MHQIVETNRERVKTHWCPNPWEWLDLCIDWNTHNYVSMSCCPLCWASDEAYLHKMIPLAELPTWDFSRAWNSARLQDIRRKWLDSDLPTMCVGCPRLYECSSPPIPRDAIKDPWRQNVIDNRLTVIPGPRVIGLGYDPSCNLACPQCRTHAIRFSPGEPRYDQLKAFQDTTVRRILATARWAFFSAYGDPFGSKLYWELLRTLRPEDCPELELAFLTNGLGFTPAAYQAILMKDRIGVVGFSIDAATSATYNRIRGGSYGLVLDNLQFVCDLKRAGKIARVEAGFVFQSANWTELPEFLEQMRSMGVNKVLVYTILDHTKNGEHAGAAVHLPNHPDHEAAMEVLDGARRTTGIDVYVELPRA